MNKIALLIGLLILSTSFAGAAETTGAAAGVNPFAVRIAALRKEHAALTAEIKKLDESKLSPEQKSEKAVYDKDLAEMGKAFSRNLKEDELAKFEKLIAVHRKTVERHKSWVANPLAPRIAALRRDHAALIAEIKKLDASKMTEEQRAEKAAYDKDLAEMGKAFSREIKEDELGKFEKQVIEHRKTVNRHKIALKVVAKP